MEGLIYAMSPLPNIIAYILNEDELIAVRCIGTGWDSSGHWNNNASQLSWGMCEDFNDMNIWHGKSLRLPNLLLQYLLFHLLMAYVTSLFQAKSTSAALALGT